MDKETDLRYPSDEERHEATGSFLLQKNEDRENVQSETESLVDASEALRMNIESLHASSSEVVEKITAVPLEENLFLRHNELCLSEDEIEKIFTSGKFREKDEELRERAHTLHEAFLETLAHATHRGASAFMIGSSSEVGTVPHSDMKSLPPRQ